MPERALGAPAPVRAELEPQLSRASGPPPFPRPRALGGCSSAGHAVLYPIRGRVGDRVALAEAARSARKPTQDYVLGRAGGECASFGTRATDVPRPAQPARQSGGTRSRRAKSRSENRRPHFDIASHNRCFDRSYQSAPSCRRFVPPAMPLPGTRLRIYPHLPAWVDTASHPRHFGYAR